MGPRDESAGGKMIVLVCKHHDGLCLWQTRYTPHSVAASPWLDGKGDEVEAVADAARKYGLKLGVYLSPADLYQLRTNPKNPGGYYGDGSSNVLSVIPTDPASFKSDPSKGRKPAPGFAKYTYVVDDYNRYFLNQLYELLTEYGPIQEVWFDGANPDPSVHETYNYNAWYDLIRHLQPNAVIMGKGPDVRWVGNEGGVGRTTEWSVVPLPTSPDQFRLAGHGGCRSRQPRQAQARFVSLVVSGGNQRHYSRQRLVVLGAAKTSPEFVGVGGYLLPVHRSQRKSHPESFAGQSRLDSRRPDRSVEQNVADHQRHIRHRPGRRRKTRRRQFQPATNRHALWTEISTLGGKPRPAKPTRTLTLTLKKSAPLMSFRCRKQWTIAANGLNLSRLITGTDRTGRWRKKFPRTRSPPSAIAGSSG